MADKLRCGVIGAGGIGLDHLHSLTAFPRAAAVALAEPNPQRAREASERFKIPRSYTDYHELLEQPDIDAVTIALPNHLHATAAIDALKARKHVLLEKPMALHAKDAARVVETARRTKRTLMVAQNFRFNRHAQAARQIIERGDLGEVYHARAFWLRRNGIPRIGSWFTQKQYAGGGCICDLGVHLLDLAFHLMNDFGVVSVSGHMHSKLGPRGLGEMNWGKSEIDPKRPFDVEDMGHALLKFKSGRSLVLEIAWAAFVPDDARDHGLDLYGTAGGLSLFPAKLIKQTPDGYQTTHLASPKLLYSEDRVQHFVSCVLEGKKPLVAPEESLKVQEILDAIYESARTGKEVRLK